MRETEFDKRYVRQFRENHPVGSMVTYYGKRFPVLESYPNFCRISERTTVTWIELARQFYRGGVDDDE